MLVIFCLFEFIYSYIYIYNIYIYSYIYTIYIYVYIYVIYTIFIYKVGFKKNYLLKKVATSVGWGMKVFSKTPSSTIFVLNF